MRIIDCSDKVFFSPLEAYKAGTPVRFETVFHDKHREKDIFVINAVCISYRPEDRKYRGKICVTNLRTGDIAYVSADRRCVCVHASVHTGDNNP